jgi:flagellar biosynthetic protein FliO
MIPELLSCALLVPRAAETTYGGGEGPDLTRYLTVCVVLLVAIAGTAFLFRRLVLGTLKAKAAGRSLQVLDVLPLGNKQRLCVVRCYDRTFALGLADHGVSLVAELDPVVGEGAPSVAPSKAEARAFAETLQSAAPRTPPDRRARGAVERDTRSAPRAEPALSDRGVLA